MGPQDADRQDTDRLAMIDRILDVIAKEGMVDRAKVTLDATLADLHIKSMDIVVILAGIEEVFSVYIPIDGPLAEATNVEAFVEHVVDHIRKQQASAG